MRLADLLLSLASAIGRVWVYWEKCFTDICFWVNQVWMLLCMYEYWSIAEASWSTSHRSAAASRAVGLHTISPGNVAVTQCKDRYVIMVASQGKLKDKHKI